MGLDMYLTGSKFLWSFNEDDQAVSKKVTDILFGENSKFKVRTLSFEVGYWRKANAIHQWFVNNIQEGEDDCRSYRVSFETLLKLRRTCLEVLAQPEKAKELLPTTSGFFFGTTEYDKYYFGDLEDTVKIINKIVDNLNEEDYYLEYSSSW